MVAREGIEPPTRGFSGVLRGFQGLSINHLQRFADPFPGIPRRNYGTLNPSWSHLRHRPLWLIAMRRYPRSIAHDNHLWLLGHDLAVFPNVNRRSVHTRHFSGSTGRAPHSTADTGGKALPLLWGFSSSGHGPRSSNLGLDS